MKLPWLSDFIGDVNTSALYDKSTRLLLQRFGNHSNFTLLYEKFAGEFSWLAFGPRTLYDRLLSTSAEALEHIFYACLVYFLVCLGIYQLIYWTAANMPNSKVWSLLRVVNNRLPSEQTLQRVLVVIAHPDDECMFFGPLIYSLTQRKNCQVYVLCLSNGNFRQQSQLRREELWRSCSVLGIPDSNIILVNATHLPDDPNVEWKTDVVAKHILNTAESLDVQALITFDDDGVSQHPNHCAVYYAAASLCLANLLPKECKFYTLESISVFRKYLSIFDLVCTLFISTYWCVLSWEQVNIIRNAMKEHKSQMIWFRWLYIYFSRYMFINTLREVDHSYVELEMQIDDEVKTKGLLTNLKLTPWGLQ